MGNRPRQPATPGYFPAGAGHHRNSLDTWPKEQPLGTLLGVDEPPRYPTVLVVFVLNNA